MKFRLLAAFLTATQIALSAACAQPPASAPPNVSSTICRPVFSVADFRYSAGTAFLLRTGVPSQNMLVTAHHLFGPDGGLDTQVAAADLPTKVRMTACNSIQIKNLWRPEAPVAIPGAHAGYDEISMLDIAAFPLNERLSIAPLGLALHAPKVGDSVWLIAEVLGGSKESLLHHGKVAKITDNVLVVVYDDAFELTATSGAPIVDESGDVIGVNAAGGYDEKSRLMLGAGTSWNAIRMALNPPN